MAPPGSDKGMRWLLAGDPAIRWQVLRDVVGASAPTVDRERREVGRAGWGARLLAKQDPEGTWAGGLSSDGGLYSPKWISTTYTMLLLRDFGVPPTNRQAPTACALLLDHGLQRDGGVNYGWRGRSETCVTGMVLSILSYFEHDDDRLPGDERLAEAIDVVRGTRHRDGRWRLQNCYKGRTFFELERPGAPSRWNTLRSLRVLKWWEGSRSAAGR